MKNQNLLTKFVSFVTLIGLSDLALAAQVPEPGSFELMGVVAVGALLLGARKRRKK